MLNSSAQKNMKQFFVTFAMVGLVTHGQIQPGFFIHDTLVMGKCIKTGFSVVASHTAFSHTAEAHFGSGKVNNGIIDAAASIGNFSQHSSDMGLIMTEQIQGKRLCLGLQGKYHVVKIFICQHRQDLNHRRTLLGRGLSECKVFVTENVIRCHTDRDFYRPVPIRSGLSILLHAS